MSDMLKCRIALNLLHCLLEKGLLSAEEYASAKAALEDRYEVFCAHC